ncbi:MAG: 2-dehydropantoate 2-reductase [Candidatus Omnitrophota bacterium]|nr:2-dehydropantoate 2-reductase [Candidatus Omnitrophota bacterium]
MRIIVIGAGAIGGVVAAYLKDKGCDVALIAKKEQAEAIKKSGLAIDGVRGKINVKIDADTKLNTPADLAILAVKTQDINEVVAQNEEFLKNSIILTTQNGIRADEIVAQSIKGADIISSIVMFGATHLDYGHITHNFEGGWIIGRSNGKIDEKLKEVEQVLNRAFKTTISEQIKGMKWTKLFINLNNCIPAVVGFSMQETFKEVEMAAISIQLLKEAFDITAKAGIKPVSLPEFDIKRYVALANMPHDEAAKIFSNIMFNLSREPLYGSILQSIKRGKASEIDYINGEFVNLAKKNGISAPLNEKLTQMVHQVEKTGKFFSKEELLTLVKS